VPPLLDPKGVFFNVPYDEDFGNPHRLQKSASDLNGTDPTIHNGTVEGVLSGLRAALGRDRPPSVPQMLKVYGLAASALHTIFKNNGMRNPYSRSVFLDLCSLSLSLGTFYPPGKPTV
jgi:hypothetical protein